MCKVLSLHVRIYMIVKFQGRQVHHCNRMTGDRNHRINVKDNFWHKIRGPPSLRYNHPSSIENDICNSHLKCRRIIYYKPFVEIFQVYCLKGHILIKLLTSCPPRYNWNINESGIKHNKPTNQSHLLPFTDMSQLQQ